MQLRRDDGTDPPDGVDGAGRQLSAFAKSPGEHNPGKLTSLKLHVQDIEEAGDQPDVAPPGALMPGNKSWSRTIQHRRALRDYTRQVNLRNFPGIVRVDKTGVVTPVADGTATITARSPEGMTATLSVRIEKSDTVTPINFPNQIVPIFTKAGCNAGGCHGKSAGQNGFRLSLLGFEPAEDYEHLVKEARGRRLFPASPERSLLLLKSTGTLPHGGGKRLEPDSNDYRLLVRWLQQGMPYGSTNDPTVARIEVLPKERTMPRRRAATGGYGAVH
jgi:hypothetical protein